MELAILGFGSNAGNRLKNIRAAIRMLALENSLDLISLSRIYETEPWGYKEQKSFLNCAAVFMCKKSPFELLRTIKVAEKKLGRVNRGRWRSREIDIDMLFFGNRILQKKNISIPHPQLSKRNFVLKPLVEIIPEFIHPLLKKSILKLSEISEDNCKVKPVRSLFR
jgi:2-amino-4-hydroxy-6-hydroxymethyldihydropteridine diphosphokinase